MYWSKILILVLIPVLVNCNDPPGPPPGWPPGKPWPPFNWTPPPPPSTLYGKLESYFWFGAYWLYHNLLIKDLVDNVSSMVNWTNGTDETDWFPSGFKSWLPWTTPKYSSEPCRNETGEFCFPPGFKVLLVSSNWQINGDAVTEIIDLKNPNFWCPLNAPLPLFSLSDAIGNKSNLLSI